MLGNADRLLLSLMLEREERRGLLPAFFAVAERPSEMDRGGGGEEEERRRSAEGDGDNVAA